MTANIPDLKRLIKTDRIEEAKEQLMALSRQPKADQYDVIEMLALASDQTALELIAYLMKDTALDLEVQDRLFQLITDRAHLNYDFTRLILAHGSPDQIRRTVPLLRHILSKETQGSILNLILRTAGKLKLTTLTDDVAEFIFYDDADLKRESVKALERMETVTALRHLEHIAATDKCDMDITDAIDMLRERLDPEDLVPSAPPIPPTAAPEPAKAQEAAPAADVPAEDEKRILLLASQQLDQRIEAYQYFTENSDQVAHALHQHIDTDNHALLVSLLRLVGRTIPQDAVGDLLELSSRKKMDKNIRFALFDAMAAYPELESAASALDAATDASMPIRIAAIKVLDRNCSDYIAAEIKKRMETGTKTAEALGISILDARASRLINALMTSDTFSYITSNYLERSAPVQVIDAYIEVLERRNQISTIKKYSRFRLKAAEIKRPFFAVIHLSPAYLDVYTKLIHSCGYEARCFTAPQEAFESIVFEKPAGVVCDVFIRQLPVLELAREIRELYSPKEVPIVVSTVQKGLDKTLTEKGFKAAGINGFYTFPATSAQIKSWGPDR